LTTTAAAELNELLSGSPYLSYSYAYPHKTAYRLLIPKVPLADAWSGEDTGALLLYLHIPFCEYRCGFCNLFTLARPDASLPTQYLAALRRQAEAVRDAIPSAQFASLAIGGGTPTFLSITELESLFRLTTDVMGARPHEIPVSCEASPATITAEKLALLREWGVSRLSLGIQSFDEQDAHAMGRPQRQCEVDSALALVREAGLPVVNLDLIYGGETQTHGNWLDSVARAIDFGADEIYLYPLYVRPLTGLGRLGRAWDDWRLSLYRAGRDLLLDRGYEQVSMRMFRRLSGFTTNVTGPVYCCQSDGMIGLGCGARSYTRSLHYSREYAVGSRAIAGILADYMRRDTADFTTCDYGIWLDDEEQRRRHVILSLLQTTGLDLSAYRSRFGSEALVDLPQLAKLEHADLATIDEEWIRLTPAGLERSDAIGPWLYSAEIRQRTEEFGWR
jgi:oxygen-independent coproporphyrinogen III oxidase